MIDFKMSSDFDVSFSSSGDFETVDNIETSIPCGLFLEKRDDDASQEFILHKRNAARGHFGMLSGEGSLLWKLYQSRLSTQVLNEARLFAVDGVQFLQNDDIAESVSGTSSTDGKDIILKIKIDKENSNIERQFRL